MRAAVLVAALAGLGLAGLDFTVRRTALPTLAVRDRPPTLVAGILGADRTLTQTVPIEGARLERVEFAVRSSAPIGARLGRLTVAGTAGGPLAATGTLVAAPFDGARHVRFELGGAALDGGGALTLTLAAAAGEPELVPHLRARGVVGARDEAGRAPRGAGEHWRVVRSDLDRLSGLALPVAASAPGAGPLTVEVFALDARPTGAPFADQPGIAVLASAPPAGPPLRRATVPVPSLVAGHLPVRFAPVEGSVFRQYAVRLTVPAGVRLIGDEDGFGVVLLHGDPTERPGWQLALGDTPLPAADAHVWVWTD